MVRPSGENPGVNRPLNRCWIHEATLGLFGLVFVLDASSDRHDGQVWIPLYFLPLALCFHRTSRIRPLVFAVIATVLMLALPWIFPTSPVDQNLWSSRLIAAAGLLLGAFIAWIFERRHFMEFEGQSGLQAIFENEPECVKLIDREGRLLNMNPAGLRMIEAESLTQVAGKCVYPLAAEEHRLALQALNERVFRGESGLLQFQIIGLKGTKRWLESHASPMRSKDGTIFAQIAITRDISDLKRLETIHAGEKEVLRLIAAGVPLVHTLEAIARSIAESASEAKVLISLQDGESQVLRSMASSGLPPAFSAGLASQLIGSAEGACGTCAFQKRAVLCEDIATDPRWEKHRKAALNCGIRSSFSIPILEQGTQLLGTVTLFGPTSSFLSTAHFQLLEIAANLGAIAITRARDEKAMRESEQRYREIFLHAPDAVFVLSTEEEDQGRILAANPAADRMHRVSPGSLVGKNFRELNSPNSAELVSLRMRQLSKDQTTQFEVDHVRGDGTVFPASVSCAQVFYKGRPCILAFDRDISRQQESEAGQRRSQEH